MFTRRESRRLSWTLALLACSSVVGCPEQNARYLFSTFVVGQGTVGITIGYPGSVPSPVCPPEPCYFFSTANVDPALFSFTLAATPAPGWSFSSWGPDGSCTGTANPLQIPSTSHDMTCRATFVPTNPAVLDVRRTGSGSGSVSGTGIDCGSDCTEAYPVGTSVTLVAAPFTGSLFAGWTGCDVPVGDSCQLVMGSNREVGAVFTLVSGTMVTVDAYVGSNGTLASSDGGLDCQGPCTSHVAYLPGTALTLTATPDAGYHVDGWLGCPGAIGGTCALVVQPPSPMTVQVLFAPDPFVRLSLVVPSSLGSGTIYGPQLACGTGGSACSADVLPGSVVALTVTPDPGSYFDHWEWDCQGIGNPTTLVMNADKACMAVFQPGGGPNRSPIAGGRGHTCAIRPDGTVRCWGQGALLGDGGLSGSLTPVTVAGIPGNGGRAAVALAAGAAHTCALLSDQTVLCWGVNDRGQLGNGLTARATTPVLVSGLSGAVSIGAGVSHTCAVLADTTVRCWGDNLFGQLGNGSTSSTGELLPVQVMRNATDPLNAMASVSAGSVFTCALRQWGYGANCWGTDISGELGIAEPPQVRLYADTGGVLSLSGLNVLSSGGRGGGTSCAALRDGTLACWGEGSFGQLGNGASTSSAVRVPVSYLSTATGVALGLNHACATISGGGVFCWGAGGAGQLGNGDILDSNLPVGVQYTSTALQVGSGAAAEHSCARLRDGTLWCWGSGDMGQLGDRTASSGWYRTIPFQVIGF